MADDPYRNVTWHDARKFGLRGLGWANEPRELPFDRLPVALRDQVSADLWRLSTSASGIHVRFCGAAAELFARWRLDGERVADENMAPLGRNGLDIYGRDAQGRWRWVGGRSTWQEPLCDGRLHSGVLDGVDREYCVYLPLMRRVASLEIGAREPLRPAPADARQPIVYYGTSIVHGATVARAGMSHAAQLGRRLGRDILNLGFCGRAWCELVMAEAFGRLDACCILVDVLPNNGLEELPARLPPFIRTLRAAKPQTPILLVGDRLYGDAAFVVGRAEERAAKNRSLVQIAADLKGEGLANLHLAIHDSWYGDDGEGTPDGSHPTDLGAWRMAANLEPHIRALLERA